MVRIIGIVIFLVFCSSSYAQKAPGYLGMKTKVSYSNILSPALGQPNGSGNSGLSAFNFTHSISIERAINRVRSIAVSLEVFKTQTDMSSLEFAELVYHPEFEGGQGGTDMLYFSGDGNSVLNVTAFSVNSVKYGTGVAPFGVNFYWGVKFLMMKQDLSGTNFIGKSNTTFSSENRGVADDIIFATEDSYSYKTLGLNIGGEVNRAIHDIVIIKIGVQSTILPTYFGKFLNGGDGGTPDFESEFEVAHAARMTWHQLFSMKIGVGILLP